MNLGEMARSYDPAVLKRDVNLVAVIMDAGVVLDGVDETRLVGHCPFHADDVASFAVWQWEDSETWACGCWACTPFRDGTAAVGDIFDFLQTHYHVTFRQAIELAVGYLGRTDLPTTPDMPKPKGPTPDLGKLLQDASKERTGLLTELLHERGVNIPAEWLYEKWRVADGNGEVLIPHFDGEGIITALKHRKPEDGWTSRSVRGSSLDHLYGEWRARGGLDRPVFLCEGESDTWTVSYIYDGEPVDVLGLPSGAAANPKDAWLDLVAGRDLVLLLDADRAGRESASKWAILASGAGARVRVGNLPDGSDCTSAGKDEVQRAVNEAWPIINMMSLAIHINDNRYYRRGKEDDVGLVLSDFVMHPTRLINMDDAIVYEVEVPGKQDVQLITDAELSSTDRLRRWSAARALSWKGTNRDVSDLLELLKLQSILVPRVRGTNVVGLHGDVFVMPNESIGSTGYSYVPPENDINLGASINLGGIGWDPDLPGLLSDLHRADVVTPILGWVAAAPLRSLVPKFPVLGVTGGSGYGKSLAIDTPIPTPSGWTTMGDLQVGDEVFDNHGTPVKVSYTTDVQYNHSCYLVTFNDGVEITADANHLWEVYRKNSNHKVGGRIKEVVDTEKMYRDFEKSRYLVKVTEPLQLPEADLPVDPYILGYWLGDGTSANGTFTCHEDDQEQLCKELANAGFEPHVANTDPQRIRTYGLGKELKEVGLLNNKHIPQQYLRASYEQRLALLQGLMDSDGYCNKKQFQCEFTSTDSELFWQVVELARSLGLRPGTGWGWASINQVPKSFKLRMWFQYPPKFNPFRLYRKCHHSPQSPLQDRFIISIKPVSSVPVRCIQVDSEDHLFLAGEGMVPTHNTTILEVILSSFGFWTSQPTTLTGATPHGLQSYVGATNSIPIWIDEYRPGARIEAKLALDQIIRDAWDGSATIKGGLHDNRMKIQKLPARAPLVVTGEDQFSETSHAERMLMIDMPKDGRDTQVLQEIRALKSPAFGRAYLQWLLNQIRRGSLPAPPNVPDRKQQARAVGRWGYELFERFCQELCGYDLPAYDDSLAKQAHAEIERTPVIVEALIESIDHTFGDGQVVCWREDDDLVLKIQPWTQRAKQMGFALPGGSRAVDKWLKEQYGAFKEMDPMHNHVTVVPDIMKGRDDE